jgi:hypothetical protein
MASFHPWEYFATRLSAASGLSLPTNSRLHALRKPGQHLDDPRKHGANERRARVPRAQRVATHAYGDVHVPVPRSTFPSVSQPYPASPNPPARSPASALS